VTFLSPRSAGPGRRGATNPDLQACADALAVVLDRARRHALLAEAAAGLHVRADDAEQRLRRAAKGLAIAAAELRRAGATEAAALVEAVRKEAVREALACSAHPGRLSCPCPHALP
jgi:hypothetical protein